VKRGFAAAWLGALRGRRRVLRAALPSALLRAALAFAALPSALLQAALAFAAWPSASRRVTAAIAAWPLVALPPAAIAAPLGLPDAPQPPAAQVALGRALFFERGLSVNGTLSCAMCHVPEQGFTANELRTSVGMEGVSLRRNAPTLLNVGYQRSFFHDGRARSLEEQALMPLLHPDEMANPDLRALVARTAKLPALRPLFVRAYGDPRPTPARIATALAAYQRTLLAGDSPFDRWRYGGDASALPAAARRGFEVFRAQGCDRCHPVGPTSSLFTDHGFHNVGIAWRSQARQRQDQPVQLVPGLTTRLTPQEIARIGVPDQPDLGRFEVTRRAPDLRAIRTPTLRNVALTGPYMHDGSFDTLEQVIDHYAAGGSPDDPAQDPLIRPLALTAADRAALVAFLQALTALQPPGRGAAAP
jgi:cytochrome c peroxidase